MLDVFYGLLWNDERVTDYTSIPNPNPPKGAVAVALIDVDAQGGPDRPVTLKSPGKIIKLTSEAVAFLQGRDWEPGMEDAGVLAQVLMAHSQDLEFIEKSREEHASIISSAPEGCPPEWAGTKYESLGATCAEACINLAVQITLPAQARHPEVHEAIEEIECNFIDKNIQVLKSI